MINDNENIIFYFLKFGSEKDILDLYENGTIYFNTIDYFQKLEEEQGLRGDSYEGSTNILNFNDYKNSKLTLTNPETGAKIELLTTRFHLREFLSGIKGNLYSLYSLKKSDILEVENFKIDLRVKQFGSHFVVIKDVALFIDNICKELNKQNFIFEGKLVTYYKKNEIKGKVTLFHKPSEFEYQKEFRVVISNNEMNPFLIKIGSLKDYAEIFECDKIDHMKIDFI